MIDIALSLMVVVVCIAGYLAVQHLMASLTKVYDRQQLILDLLMDNSHKYDSCCGKIHEELLLINKNVAASKGNRNEKRTSQRVAR